MNVPGGKFFHIVENWNRAKPFYKFESYTWSWKRIRVANILI